MPSKILVAPPVVENPVSEAAVDYYQVACVCGATLRIISVPLLPVVCPNPKCGRVIGKGRSLFSISSH